MEINGNTTNKGDEEENDSGDSQYDDAVEDALTGGN